MLAVAAVFILLQHCTVHGRRIYAIGANPVAARFSGIAVQRYRLLLFTVAGLMAALVLTVAAPVVLLPLFFTSWAPCSRPSCWAASPSRSAC